MALGNPALGLTMQSHPQATPDAAVDPRPPELSIIVLTYNRAVLLRDCFDSLAAQTYPANRLEIIVADDGSSDGTAQFVHEYGTRHPNVRYVRHDHYGIPATRNLGLRHVRAALVAMVADDYVLDPVYAETIVRFFREHEYAVVLRFGMTAAGRDFGSRISDTYYRASVLRRLSDTTAGGGPPSLWRLPEPPRTVTTRHSLDASGAAAFRREVFDRIGVFDESLARAEDSDLTIRLRRDGIAIHYFPCNFIRHQYDPYLRDTLMKSWHTGWYRYHHYRKNALGADGAGKVVPDLVRGKLMGLLAMLQQARSEHSARWVLLALPFVALFELVNKAGFLCSWLSVHRPGTHRH